MWEMEIKRKTSVTFELCQKWGIKTLGDLYTEKQDCHPLEEKKSLISDCKAIFADPARWLFGTYLNQQK